MKILSKLPFGFYGMLILVISLCHRGFLAASSEGNTLTQVSIVASLFFLIVVITLYALTELKYDDLLQKQKNTSIVQFRDYILQLNNDSNQDIQIGDWCIVVDDLENPWLGPDQYMGQNTNHSLHKHLRKVVSHIPLNNAPRLEGVPILQ